MLNVPVARLWPHGRFQQLTQATVHRAEGAPRFVWIAVGPKRFQNLVFAHPLPRVQGKKLEQPLHNRAMPRIFLKPNIAALEPERAHELHRQQRRRRLL